MKSISKLFLFVWFALFIITCSENKSDNKPEKIASDLNVPDKKMCELLTMGKMTSITGVKFNEEMTTLHQTDKATGKYVSQCGYYSDGGNMGVLVRRFGNTSFPKEKENLVGGKETGNAEVDALMHKALETCKTVNGLGDAAYFYDLGGITNLIVVFKDHYQAHITSYGKGFGFDDNTLQISKKVAEEVMKIF